MSDLLKHRVVRGKFFIRNSRQEANKVENNGEIQANLVFLSVKGKLRDYNAYADDSERAFLGFLACNNDDDQGREV